MAAAGDGMAEDGHAEYVGSVEGRNSPASPLSSVDGLDPGFTASMDVSFGLHPLQIDQERRQTRRGMERSITVQRASEPEIEFAIQDSYFPPLGLLRGNGIDTQSRVSSISGMSSSVPSAGASSSSLRSSHDGEHDLVRTHQALEPFGARPGVTRDDSTASTQTIISLPLTPECNDTPPTATPPTPTQTTTQKRCEGPVYPDQSFAALQPQYYPPPYQPYSLRARSSHNSPQLSSYSPGSSKQLLDQSGAHTGAKTVGSTPAHSPGLFTTGQRPGSAMGEFERSHAGTPLLHPAHMQAPKETHKVLRGEDPISGRKIINNYEFWEKLGSGAHGTVKRGRNLETDIFVAVKIVRRFSKKLKLGKSGDPDDEVKKEVAVLKKARHPHVVSLFEVIDDKDYDKVYLILEYVERGEIIWRKRTDKDVALFEMNHVKREKAGDFDQAFEEAEIERFNDNAPARRAAKACILAEQRRQAEARHAANKSQKARGHGPGHIPEQGSSTVSDAYYWSLEYGGESENELGMAKPTPFKAPVGKLEIKIPESATIVSQTPSIAESEQLESEEHAALSGLTSGGASSLEYPGSDLKVESRTTSPVNLEGTMYGPYAYERTNHGGSEADIKLHLERIIAEQDRWTAEEEEFMHVPCLTLSQAREAFRDTVLGLEYLHYQGIIHRDIKPANLLWTADYRVKISDFGVSYLGRPIREDEKGEENYEANAANLDEAIELAKTVGTPLFYAPELCDPELFDTEKNPERPLITGQIDVWALGVTLYGMVYGRLPFVDVNEFVMYERIAREEVFIPRTRLRGVETSDTSSMNSNKRLDDVIVYEEVDDALRDLLKRLLHKQPGKRISLKEVKHHPWVLRGIPDPGAWIDETDPSMQSQGKKIEVSTEDIQQAVVGLTLVDRIKSGIKRLSSVVRGRDQRKRAESSVKTADSASAAAAKGHADSREGRRSSVRGDEQIFTALKASRETAEHPLAHTVAAIPAVREGHCYFDDGYATAGDTMTGLVSVNSSPRTRLPYVPERATSAAESVRTIRAPPPINVRQGTPPSSEDLPNSTTAVDVNAPTGLSGIFSGAGRRFVQGMRSRELVRDGTSQSSRSSSVEGSPHIEDSHASPSIAFSSTVAAGHVDQPPVLRDLPSPVDANFPTSPRHPQRPSGSTPETFQRAQEQNYRRYIMETERDSQSRPCTVISPTYDCPPSPDDETFYAKQQAQQQQHRWPSHDEALPLTATSSSDDQFPSCISESYSHPNIPSVVSGASSLSTVPDAYHHSKEMLTTPPFSAYASPEPAVPPVAPKAPPPRCTADDDEAGYNGDGDGNGANYDDDDDDDSEDEGIMFGSKKQRANA
ncbi:serine threonine-protein kinase ssp1 [Lasallia pustulata]|uniref:non-specific serine/threonine protein kinase n=1 Tax=Lasallia pustulata TaxID=136370 RepID=A0A1W5DCN3_9LECA|nr:serine threonine-protein kinase ssp1 [Lasallia pustulata]